MVKRISIFAIIFIIVVFTIEHANGETSNKVNSLHKYSKGILFNIKNWGELDQSLNVGVGGRLNINSNYALRVVGNYSSSAYKSTNIDNSENDTDSEKHYSREYEILAQIIYYPCADNKICPFFAVGPSFGLNSESWANYTYRDDAYWLNTIHEYFSIWSLGLTLSVGAECFVADNISITSEYSMRFKYNWGNKQNRIFDSRDKVSEYLIESSPVSCGVSFYF